MNKKFNRVVEDFSCINCGTKVSGSGYTNHCPECLTSLHVDLESPGDRNSNCHGIMQAVALKLKGGEPYKILFHCKNCGKEILNRVQKEDNLDKVRELPLIT